MRLAGRIALVTGGSRGIGRAIALALAAEGADVGINCVRHVEAAEEVAARVRSLGRRAVVAVADVADAEAVRRMVADLQRTLGPLDILINNAGHGANTDFLTASPEVLPRMLAVHVVGTFNCTRAVLPGMIERRWGRIVNISSVAALRGVPYNPEYCTAKAALLGFTRSLAARYGREGITVNAIAPGIIHTDFHADKSETFWEKARRERVPLGREGQADEVAHAALYLCTNPYVTGEVVVVDGGLTMRIA